MHGVVTYILMALFIFVSIIMVLIVLIQKGRGGGLSGAFGGSGGNTAFGSKTGDVLTWATSIVFAVFVILAVALNLVIGVSSKAKAANATNNAPAQMPVPSPQGTAPH